MKNLRKKSFLAGCFSILASIQGASVNISMLEEIKNGICPDGLEYTCSILAGGCSALPGAIAHANLNKNFTDIPTAISFGISSISGVAAVYTFYKIHQSLSSRTKQAILKQKASLLETINRLRTHEILSEQSIIDNLKLEFTDQVAQGYCISIMINLYLEKLINNIEWANPKLIFLGETPIDTELIEILKKTRTSIVTSPNYPIQRTMHQNHEKEVYNNQLSTKIKQGAWWTTKKTVQAGVVVTKIGISACWDLFKIILSNITRNIV